ncbi:unnamed protein product [Lathyrus sativus]|nr:unnamed protein product [Lathyrus sativus]
MSNKTDGPTIIVLTHAWYKKNAVLGMALDFLLTLIIPKLNPLNPVALSHSLIQPCDSSIQTTNKGWTSSNEVESIYHINALGKDCFATTIGTTKRFKASKHEWYFESCLSCKTSNKSPRENFVCICRVKDVEPITKFKIEFDVEYENHVGYFVFWDKGCIPFVEMTTTQLRELMKEAGDDNPKIYPAQLDKLLNKDLAFRIKYQSFFQQFSIVTIIKDDDVYKNLDKLINPNEHTSNASVFNFDTSNPKEVQDYPIMTPSAEHTKSAQPSTSVNHTWSPSASSSNTPTKMVSISTSLDELFQNEDLTHKQPATKAKHLKKE